MLGGQRRARAGQAHRVLARAAAAVLIAAILVDTAGLLTDRVLIWTVGAHLTTAAIALAALAVITGAITRVISRRRAAAALVAILLLATARYVRGHPEVRPDPPIFGAEVLAGIALLILLRISFHEDGVHRGGGEGRGGTPRTNLS